MRATGMGFGDKEPEGKRYTAARSIDELIPPVRIPARPIWICPLWMM